jgi:carbon storage regulator
MLLITRREGEAIVINGTIEVKILEIRGGRVKLGFEYPAGNTVFRQELFAKIQAENQAAALAGSTQVPGRAETADAKRLTDAMQKLQPKPKSK